MGVFFSYALTKVAADLYVFKKFERTRVPSRFFFYSCTLLDGIEANGD